MEIGQKVAIIKASHGLGALAGECTGQILYQSTFANGPMYLVALDPHWERQVINFMLEGTSYRESDLEAAFRITEAKGLPNIGDDGRYGFWALPYEIVSCQ